jgi:glutamyl-tRNA synthetase
MVAFNAFTRFLYRAFGWEAPEFAHLPLIMKPSNGKLSKRDGDGIPLFPLIGKGRRRVSSGYREKDFPEAVLNF